MFIIQKIKSLSFDITTLFGLGDKKFGVIYTTLIALPITFLFKLLYNFIPAFYINIALLSLLALYFLILFLALIFVTQKDKTTIVVNNLVGIFFVFWGIKFNIKFIITGFILYHILYFVAPLIFYKLFNRKVDTLPAFISIFFIDIVYGFFANLFLRFLIWLAR